MIRRPPRSTQSRSSAASDVYKRQVLRTHTSDLAEKIAEENLELFKAAVGKILRLESYPPRIPFCPPHQSIGILDRFGEHARLADHLCCFRRRLLDNGPRTLVGSSDKCFPLSDHPSCGPQFFGKRCPQLANHLEQFLTIDPDAARQRNGLRIPYGGFHPIEQVDELADLWD